MLQQPITVATFNPVTLIAMGFEFMGNCWGNSNLPYHKIETQLGTLCVVDNRSVYLIRGNREDHLERITSISILNQFISSLS